MDNNNKPKSVIGNKRPSTDNEKTKSFDSKDFINYKPEKKVNKTTGNKSQYSIIKDGSRTRRKSEVNRDDEAFKQRRKNYRRKKRIKDKQAAVKPTDRTKSVSKEETPSAENVLKNNKYIRILLYIIAVFVVLFLALIIYAKFTPLNPDLSGNVELFSISSDAAAVAGSHRIANIAIFGVDGREDVEGERSDAIMIGSADFEHNKLKVTSLMRDTYTEMADEDYFDKLNAAYALGGPTEAVKTINLNFDTPVTDYVVFDFTALVAMVNAVGGVDINITDEDELYWTNQYLMDVNDKVKTQDPDVPATGLQHLTGSQALAYARIRYVGNGDYDRTQRQRNILEQVVAKASQMGPIKQLNVIRQVMPYIETSLRPSEIFKYALNFMLMRDRTIMQNRLPQDGMSQDGYLDGVSYIFPMTLDDNIKAWYQFVYEIDYTPSPRAQEISEEIEYTW